MSSFKTDNATLNKTMNEASLRCNVGKHFGDKIELSRDGIRFNPDFRVVHLKDGRISVSINTQYRFTHMNAAIAFSTAVEKYLHAMTGK